MRFLPFALISLLIISCGNHSAIKVSEIRYLYVDCHPDTHMNYGSSFTGTIGAQMQTGEILFLKDNRDFNSSYNIHCAIKNQTITIAATPQAFNVNKVPVELLFWSKTDTIRSRDTLRLDFKAPITIAGTVARAKDGPDGKSRSTPLVFRDGNPGGDGEPGEQGLNGDNYEIHIWKDSLTYYIHAFNQTKGTIGRYQVCGKYDFTLDASGGKGGDGGDGGDGGTGKDGQLGEKPKDPGNGGNGGKGANGGNGGNGGEIRCIIHPSAADFKSNLKIAANSGFGGSAGTGGKAGSPGTTQTGQTAAKSGTAGSDGRFGNSGQSGGILVVEENFAIEGYR